MERLEGFKKYSILAYGLMDTLDYNGQFYFFVDNIFIHSFDLNFIFGKVISKIKYLAKNNKLTHQSGHVRECTLVMYNNGELIDYYPVELNHFKDRLTIL